MIEYEDGPTEHYWRERCTRAESLLRTILDEYFKMDSKPPWRLLTRDQRATLSTIAGTMKRGSDDDTRA